MARIRPDFRAEVPTGFPEHRHPGARPVGPRAPTRRARAPPRGRPPASRIACRSRRRRSGAGSASSAAASSSRPSGPSRPAPYRRGRPARPATGRPPGPARPRGPAGARVGPPYAASSSGRTRAGRGSADCSDRRWSRPRPTPGRAPAASPQLVARTSGAAGSRRRAADRRRRARSARRRAPASAGTSRPGRRGCGPPRCGRRPGLRAARSQEGVAQPAGARPRTTALGCRQTPRRRRAPMTNGRPSARRQVAAERLVPIGRRPRAVVEVRGACQLKLAVLGQLSSRSKQRRPSPTRPTARPARGCPADTARDGRSCGEPADEARECTASSRLQAPASGPGLQSLEPGPEI